MRLLPLLLTLPAVVQAQFQFVTNNGTITITKYTGSGGAVTIPSTTNGYPVTSIGPEAFSECTSLSSLTIGTNVTSIEDWAFQYCSNLTSVTMPNSVTKIGDGPFYDCTSLASASIPKSVTSIGIQAFQNCTSLSSVTIGTNVTNIGVSAFAVCTSLASIAIPNGVTNIGSGAFYYCTNLASVAIGNSVTSIGQQTFQFCSLTNVTFPSSITSIGAWAFLWCTNLNGAYFEGNAPSIGTNVFYLDNNPTVYYLPGTTGWASTFADRPTALWNPCATATATLAGGLVETATVTDGGCLYTNIPLIRLVSGGGSGAQAVAVVSNGVVVGITITDPGIGYTSTPLVVIEPPFIFNPVLSIAPMSFLAFSNLTVGGVYQLQQAVAWYWSNQPVRFTATNALDTQMVAGVAGSGDYRLALNLVPAQAFATAVVEYGFVVHATVTSGGSGYVTSPAVTIVGGGGTNATAVSQISGGVVTNIAITSTGIGYTNTPAVEIAQPPAAALSPTTVLAMMRVDSANLAPYDNYQIQFKPDLSGAWGNWNGGLFSPIGVTNSQYLFVTNGVGFFRLQYVP